MTWIRTVPGNGAVAFIILLLLAVSTTPAVAASEKRGSKTPPGQARFEGHRINLQRGWGDARACVVWNEDGETDCYRAEQAADAAVARRERAEARQASMQRATWTSAGLDRRVAWQVPTVQFVSTCGDWLYLYEHSGFHGRSLRFRDRGITQDLGHWGFANQTSSYHVGGCGVALRDAGGLLYPGWTGTQAHASSMSPGWNDRIRYLRIN